MEGVERCFGSYDVCGVVWVFCGFFCVVVVVFGGGGVWGIMVCFWVYFIGWMDFDGSVECG